MRFAVCNIAPLLFLHLFLCAGQWINTRVSLWNNFSLPHLSFSFFFSWHWLCALCAFFDEAVLESSTSVPCVKHLRLVQDCGFCSLSCLSMLCFSLFCSDLFSLCFSSRSPPLALALESGKTAAVVQCEVGHSSCEWSLCLFFFNSLHPTSQLTQNTSYHVSVTYCLCCFPIVIANLLPCSRDLWCCCPVYLLNFSWTYFLISVITSANKNITLWRRRVKEGLTLKTRK